MLWLDDGESLLAVTGVRILCYPGLGQDAFCLMAYTTGRYGKSLEIPLRKGPEQEVRSLFEKLREKLARGQYPLVISVENMALIEAMKYGGVGGGG